MEIDRELTEAGLTEELLLFFHSRTANNNKKIEKAFAERYSWRNYPKPSPGSTLSFKVKFEGGGEAEYTLEVAKVRQKRLNLLLMKNK